MSNRHWVTDLKYKPQLDGLRAVAVIAVAWSHWERPYQFGIPFGVGVHLFYVLSGFLITGILLNTRAQAERGRGLFVFYVRRALRIFPAFYLTLALAWWADIPYVRESLAWHAAYLSNVYIFLRREWPGSISHFWSLAVEEQFYLVWPWLIVFAPRRWLLPAIIAAIAIAPLFRWLLAAQGYPESMHAVLMPGCLDSLGVGALIAVARPRTLLVWPVSAAYVALLVAQGFGLALPLALVVIKQTLQALVFGWIIVRANDGFAGITGRLLSAVPIVYLGRISYGLYLVHGFAGALAATLFFLLGLNWPPREPWRLFLLIGVTVGAAALSWHLVERPINRLKRLVQYGESERSTKHEERRT